MRRATSANHRASTNKELQGARKRHPKPNANMLRSMLPEFFSGGGVVVDIGMEIPNTYEIAALRAAGYICRKHRGTPKQRARRRRRLLRRIKYFKSDAGIAQMVEVRMQRAPYRDDVYSFAE